MTYRSGETEEDNNTQFLTQGKDIMQLKSEMNKKFSIGYNQIR